MIVVANDVKSLHIYNSIPVVSVIAGYVRRRNCDDDGDDGVNYDALIQFVSSAVKAAELVLGNLKLKAL